MLLIGVQPNVKQTEKDKKHKIISDAFHFTDIKINSNSINSQYKGTPIETRK